MKIVLDKLTVEESARLGRTNKEALKAELAAIGAYDVGKMVPVPCSCTDYLGWAHDSSLLVIGTCQVHGLVQMDGRDIPPPITHAAAPFPRPRR